MELLVVLVVVGLFLVVIGPGRGFLATADPVRRAAVGLAAACREAREQAIRAGTDQDLYFDLDGQRYGLVDAGATPAAGSPLPAGVRLAAVVVRRAGKPVRRGVVRLRCSRKGTVTPAVLHLAGRDHATMSVVVDRFLATAAVRPGWVPPPAAGLGG